MKDMSPGKQGDIKADKVCHLKGYLKKLKSIRFLYHCSLFTDLFENIAILSLVFQSDDMPIYRVADQMDSAIAELVLLKTKDGEHLKLFRRKLEVNDGNCVFERVTFKSSGQSMELYDRKRRDFIESVVACIIVNRKGRRGLEDRQTSKGLARYVEGAHHVITKVHKRPEV